MKSAVKIVLTTVLTSLLFCGCVFVALYGGLSFVELRFWRPRVTAQISSRLDIIGAAFDKWSDALISDFSVYATQNAVASFVEREASDNDIALREQLTVKLLEKIPGLEGIRLVQDDGHHVHFSTYAADITKQGETFLIYAYYDTLNVLPYQHVAAHQYAAVHADVEKGLFVFSIPFVASAQDFRGTLLFYVDENTFLSQLQTDGILKERETFSVVTFEPSTEVSDGPRSVGLVFSLPILGSDVLLQKISENWSSGKYGVEPIFQMDEESGTGFSLLTADSCRHALLGWILRTDDASFSKLEQLLFAVAVFITLYLLIFLLFNLKRDLRVAVATRLSAFQSSFIAEYRALKKKMESDSFEQMLADCRHEYEQRALAAIGKIPRKHTLLDDMIARSWNEVCAALQTPVTANNHAVPAAVQKNKTTELGTKTTEPARPAPTDNLEEAPTAEPADELEEVPEAEAVYEAGESAAEPADELEEAPEAEAVYETEESAAEPADELEEVPEAEAVDEAGESAAEPADKFEITLASQQVAKAELVDDVDSGMVEAGPSNAETVDEPEQIENLISIPMQKKLDPMQDYRHRIDPALLGLEGELATKIEMLEAEAYDRLHGPIRFLPKKSGAEPDVSQTFKIFMPEFSLSKLQSLIVKEGSS